VRCMGERGRGWEGGGKLMIAVPENKGLQSGEVLVLIKRSKWQIGLGNWLLNDRVCINICGTQKHETKRRAQGTFGIRWRFGLWAAYGGGWRGRGKAEGIDDEDGGG
jgi:hypothetical protein